MSDSASAAVTIPARRHHAALIFCILWVLLWYRQTIMGMAQIWERSQTFTHGFIVPPIALWLVWRLRPKLAQLTPRPAPWALILIALTGLVWLLGDLAAVNSVTQLALVALLILIVPATMGQDVARTLAFPLGFLFFAVPIGEFFLPQLMEWTANFTVLALRLTGIPVYREGLHFVIPSGHWSVVEACSGVRYLIASLMVGVLFAYLNYTSLKRRLMFIGVAVVVPIIANWLRAYMIVMLGHLSSNRLAAGVDHLIYGWLFFGVVITLMFVIGARWSETPAPDDQRLPPPTSVQKNSSSLWIVTALVAALTAAPQVAHHLIEGGGAADPVLSASIGGLSGGWQQSSESFTDWQPAFNNPSAQFKGAFAHGERRVGLYIGFYRNQDYERKLVSSSNVIVSSHDKLWVQVANGVQVVDFSQQKVAVRTATLHSNASSLSANADRLRVWQVYWIDGYLTTNDHIAKIRTAISRLLGRGDDSAAIILYAPLDQPGGAEAALESFVQANAGSVMSILREAGDRR